MKLHQLLTLTPPRPVTRYERRQMWWRVFCVIGWGLVYLIAILGAGMTFID